MQSATTASSEDAVMVIALGTLTAATLGWKEHAERLAKATHGGIRSPDGVDQARRKHLVRSTKNYTTDV
ncbi:hypothetical protein KXD40_001500 [Peronospora effusa]|nr:hypothetical protein KXD40_001500 [Peronospora effusa]